MKTKYYLHSVKDTIQGYEVLSFPFLESKSLNSIQLTFLEGKLLKILLKEKEIKVSRLLGILFSHHFNDTIKEVDTTSFHGKYLYNSFRVLLCVLRKKIKDTNLTILSSRRLRTYKIKLKYEKNNK